MMKTRSLLLAVMPILALGISFTTAHATRGPGTPGASGDPSVAEYVDVSAFLTTDADVDAWYTLLFNLKRNFDQVCGDTFCEGEYSNIQSLRYRCSVERTSGTLGSCTWVFAASNEEINPLTGKVMVDAQVWRCRSPLVRGTNIHDFLAALSGSSPLHSALPRTARSIYDGLTDCL